MDRLEQTSRGNMPPLVAIDPVEIFSSKISPIYTSEIRDGNSGETIGTIQFELNHKAKTITIDLVRIYPRQKGYGSELYKTIQRRYPGYVLQSSDQMTKKEKSDQEKPNAVYLWEKLVREGVAEGDEKSGFKMKSNM